MFFNFGALQNFSDIFEGVTFFLASWLSNQLSFSVAVHIYKILIFDEAFSLLTIAIPMIIKLFRVVTSFEELSPIDMHDISI